MSENMPGDSILMQKKSLVTLGFVVLVLALLTTAWIWFQNSLVDTNETLYVKNPPTPQINATADQQFYEYFPLGSYETNTGLTIERLNTFAIKEPVTPAVNDISFIVLNHTEESIVFDDISFGLSLFQYDSELMKWVEISLPYVPERTKQVLPARTEAFDYDVLNVWELDADMLTLTTNTIRIVVKGKGMDSDKKYVGYLDLSLRERRD